MMWILIEMNIKGIHKKFMGSQNYDTLIKHINTFEDVRKIDDYHFESADKNFIIQMCEMLDWREVAYDKHSKSKKTRYLQTKKVR